MTSINLKTFEPGAIARAEDVNANFTALRDAFDPADDWTDFTLASGINHISDNHFQYKAIGSIGIATRGGVTINNAAARTTYPIVTRLPAIFPRDVARQFAICGTTGADAAKLSFLTNRAAEIRTGDCVPAYYICCVTIFF